MSKFRLMVIKPNGVKEPFMRGILTHSLVQRGLPFKKAYKVAQTIRERLSKKDEIMTAELNIIVNQEIEKKYGYNCLESLKNTMVVSSTIINIVSENGTFPFSRELLSKPITATGFSPTQAYQLTQELENELRQDGVWEIKLEEVYQRLYDKIVAIKGKEFASLYELSRNLKKLDKPVIIYLGGSGGTGKSTLAMELASRLGIMKVTGTDTIRQIMRMVFTKQIIPSLHSSSFEAGDFERFWLEGDDKVLAGYTLQSFRVCAGVHAVVERAIKENMSMVIEGVHLLPSLLQLKKYQKQTYQIPIVLSLMDEPNHRARFVHRHEQSQRTSRYDENFHSIRLIHDHFIAQANQYDIDIINNTDFDSSLDELVQTVMDNLQKQIRAHHHKDSKEKNNNTAK
ncbi:MAG: hypothetical protein HQM11_08320 [SAR324 cluster bacterium]|nr:hypothetical protein [SAR324 cluster bacterium]